MKPPKLVGRHPRTPLITAGLLSGLGFGQTKEEAEKKEDELTTSIKYGILAMEKGELDKAENLLHISLRMAQDLHNPDGVIYIYDLLANIAFQRGDYMKAERLFKDVMQKIASKGTPPEDNAMVEISLKLATVYATWKQDLKAETGFKFCIDTMEKKVKHGTEDDMALWGMSREWYAQFLLDRGRKKEAFNEYQEAFLTSCELYGNTHSQSLVLLNSLGTVSSLMDDHKQAVQYFEKAVRLAKKTDNDDASAFLVNLGMARIRQGMYNEAVAACTEGWRLGKKQNNSEVIDEANACLKTASQMK